VLRLVRDLEAAGARAYYDHAYFAFGEERRLGDAVRGEILVVPGIFVGGAGAGDRVWIRG
jgi:hypothetical protein